MRSNQADALAGAHQFAGRVPRTVLAERRAGVPTVGALTRVAVLPFENLGPAADADLAAGPAEAIRGQLATLPTLAVIDARRP